MQACRLRHVAILILINGFSLARIKPFVSMTEWCDCRVACKGSIWSRGVHAYASGGFGRAACMLGVEHAGSGSGVVFVHRRSEGWGVNLRTWQ